MKKRLFGSSILMDTMLALLHVAALADTSSQDVSINIKGGTLDLGVADINSFGTHTLAPKKGKITSAFKDSIVVEDSTGLQEGWSLSITTTDFVETSNTSLTIPATSLTLIKPVVQDLTDGTGKTASGITVFSDERVTLTNGSINIASGQAGSSAGTYEFTFGENSSIANSTPLGSAHLLGQALELTINPSTIKVLTGGGESEFKSTITWTLSAGPGN